MKPIASLSTEQIAAEITRLERRPYRSKSKWAMRLFDLRQELSRRSPNSVPSVASCSKTLSRMNAEQLIESYARLEKSEQLKFDERYRALLRCRRTAQFLLRCLQPCRICGQGFDLATEDPLLVGRCRDCGDQQRAVATATPKNARLFAAAKEMRAALTALADYLEVFTLHYDPSDSVSSVSSCSKSVPRPRRTVRGSEVLAQARAALAKVQP